jgi:hypothetical protein
VAAGPLLGSRCGWNARPDQPPPTLDWGGRQSYVARIRVRHGWRAPAVRGRHDSLLPVKPACG